MSEIESTALEAELIALKAVNPIVADFVGGLIETFGLSAEDALWLVDTGFDALDTGDETG